MRPGPVSRVKETLCSAAGESRSRAYLTGRRLPAHRPPVLRVAVFFSSSSSLSLSLPKTAATCLAYQVITAEKGPLLQFCCSLPLSFISFSFLSAFRLNVNKIETISVVRRMKSDRRKKKKNLKVKTKSRDQPDDHYRPTSGPTFKLRQIFVSGPRISEWFQRTERNVTWWKWTKWAIRFFRSSFVFSGRTRR